jgi:hypothetical protein
LVPLFAHLAALLEALRDDLAERLNLRAQAVNVGTESVDVVVGLLTR